MIISANTQSACHLITTLCTETITVALFEWLLIMKSLEDLWSHLINCLAGVDWPFSPHTLDYILCSISGAWPPQRWSSLLSPVFTQFPSSHPGHQHTRCHTRLVISWHLIEENKFFFALLTSLHSWKLWLQWLLWSLGGDVTIKWQDSVICSVTAEHLQLQCEDISFCHIYCSRPPVCLDTLELFVLLLVFSMT